MLKKLSFVLVLWIRYSLGHTGGVCDVQFKKIGCFNDDQNEPRPVPTLIFNDRDGSNEKAIDWKNWDRYVDDVTCRCAKEAAKYEFGYFALQFYGECWSGKESGATFPRAGKSSHCVSVGFQKCIEFSKRNCVGESLANFVYLLSANESLCHVKYKKVGCYNNNQAKPRAFPILLLTDRNPNSPRYSNVSLDLIHWNSYMMDLACRCAAKTMQNKYKYFTLQNFGECWSGPVTELPVMITAGNQNICIGKNYQKCSADDVVCVGESKSNYVFNIITL